VQNPEKKKSLVTRAFLDGRYWARTSDPQLVELVLILAAFLSRHVARNRERLATLEFWEKTGRKFRRVRVREKEKPPIYGDFVSG
jgi:hypothetical protein